MIQKQNERTAVWYGKEAMLAMELNMKPCNARGEITAYSQVV